MLKLLFTLFTSFLYLHLSRLVFILCFKLVFISSTPSSLAYQVRAGEVISLRSNSYLLIRSQLSCSLLSPISSLSVNLVFSFTQEASHTPASVDDENHKHFHYHCSLGAAEEKFFDFSPMPRRLIDLTIFLTAHASLGRGKQGKIRMILVTSIGWGRNRTTLMNMKFELCDNRKPFV